MTYAQQLATVLGLIILAITLMFLAKPVLQDIKAARQSDRIARSKAAHPAGKGLVR